MELKYFKQVSSVKELNNRINQYNLEKRKIGILSYFNLDKLPPNSKETEMIHTVSWIVEEIVQDTLAYQPKEVDDITLFQYVEKCGSLTEHMRHEMETEGLLLTSLFESNFYTVNSLISEDVIETFN